MNTIYNVVWNSTTGTWVVASEMAKGRKKKSKAASAATAAVLVTAAGLGAGAMLMPGTALAGAGVCVNQKTYGYTQTGCGGVGGVLESSYAYNSASYLPLKFQIDDFVLINATVKGGANPPFVSAMWLNGDDGSINFDVGPQWGQIVKINQAGRMTGLTDGAIASGSTDAVTGNQLFALQTKVESGNVKYFHTNTNLADSVTTGEHSIAIGGNAASKGLWSVSIGTNSAASGSNSVAIGNSSVADRDTSVAVGNSATQRQIIYVAKGTKGTDAVNVDQLKGVTAVIGGDAAVNADGSISKAGISVDGTKYDTVAAAIAAVGTKAGSNKYFHVNSTGADSVATGGESVAIGSNAKAVGAAAIAMGQNATTAGNNSTAIGGDSKSGDLSVSIGNGANTSASTWAVGMGTNAKVTGSWGVALGAGTQVTGANAAAIGANSIADRDNSVSVGSAGAKRQVVNVASGTADTDAVNVSQLNGVSKYFKASAGTDAQIISHNAVAAGSGAVAGTAYSTAIGSEAHATGFESTAVGFGAHANGLIGTAVGFASSAEGDRSVAIGSEANVDAGDNPGVAIGRQSHVTGKSSIALGAQSLADRDSTVSVGNADLQRQITNLAMGTAGTDALNVDQLKSAGFTLDAAGSVTNAAVTYKAGSIASGSPVVVLEKGQGDSKYFVDGDRTKGKLAKGTVISNVADGTLDTDAANLGSVHNIVAEAVAGGGAPRLLVPLVAGVGSGVNTTGLTTTYKTAAYYSQVAGKGDSAGSTPPSDVARAAGAGSIAVGSNAFANATSATAVGVQAYATPTATDAVALGSGSVASEANTVSLGSDGKGSYTAYDATGTAYTITNQANTRRLVNLSAGKAATDGVNVSQLQPVVDGLGGGAKVDTSTGAVTGPIYTVDGGKTVTNVGDAITNIDGRVTNVTNTVNNITNGGGIKYFHSNTKLADSTTTGADSIAIGGNAASDGKWALAAGTNAKATADNSVALGNSSLADRANSVSVGSATTQRQITNLAKGTADTDAVNVSQLKGVTAAIGGGATVKSDGSIDPGFTIGSTKYGSVAEAVAAVDAKAGTGNPLGVAYDDGTRTKVTLNKGGTTGAVTIANVAAGQVSSGSKDAINGSQLYGTAQSVAAGLGGGAAVNADGTVKAPSYTVQGQPGIADVGTALGKLDTATTSNTTNINNVISGKSGLVQQAAAGQKLTVGKATDGTEVDMTGTAGMRQLTGVAKGLGDSAALNVAQLKSAGFTLDGTGSVTNQAVTYKAGSIASGSPVAMLDKGQGDSAYFVDGDRTKGKLPKGTVLSNVANGKQDTDAANIGTVYDIVSQVGANGAASRMLVPLVAGEGSGVDTTGLTVNYKTAAYYSQVAGKGDSAGSTPPSDVARAAGAGSIAVGSNAFANATSATVVGVQAYAASTASDAVALGSGSVASEANTVSLGSDGKGSYTAYDATGAAYTIANQANTRRLVNLAAGKADTDGVNVSQLKGVTAAIGGGTAVNPDGSIKPGVTINGKDYGTVAEAITAVDAKAGTGSALGVAYDDDTKTRVTLNKGGTTGAVTIANVKAGVNNDEAVNVKQLKDIGLLDPGTGEVLDAVVYDKGSNKGSVSFGGASGTRLKNVAAGLVSPDSKEAINGSQLYATGKSVADALGGGSEVNADGTLKKPVITIDNNDYSVADAIKAVDAKVGTGNSLGVAYDDASKAKVTLNQGGSAVTISNVKNGIGPTDAINMGQLKPLVDGLGGDANVDPTTGVVTGPTYNLTKIDGTSTTVHNVGDAITNLDSRTTQNTTNISNVLGGKAGLVQQAAAGEKLTVGKDTDGTEVNFTGKNGDRKLSGVAKGTADNDAVNVKQLKDAGLVDGDGNVANAVTYDSDAKDSVTLGNAGKAVTLKNVANGTKDDEAINLGQLKSTGLVGEGGAILDAVTYDAGSNKASVTFGGGINGTVLNNVADGRIGAGSREAINGGQIAAIKDALEGKITNIDNRVTRIEENGVGGGTPGFISANGVGGSPMPANAGTSPGVAMGYDSTASGDGASAIGDHANATGMDSVAIGNNASTTATGANSVALGNGSVADRANTVSVGSEGHERTISNVARGNADTDAVNVGLLDERVRNLGASATAYTDKLVNDVWSNLKEEIDHSSRQANRGIAAASALINVTPYVPGHVTVNAGVAGYRGESALGVGVSRWSENGRVNLNAGVSAAQGDEPVYRVGIGYIF